MSLTVEVKREKTHFAFTLLRVASAVPILFFSISLYLTGLLLTITIVGAPLGIPLIVLTYALDALALSMLLNPREKIAKVHCPKCGKSKHVLPSAMDDFTCKACKSYIKIYCH